MLDTGGGEYNVFKELGHEGRRRSCRPGTFGGSFACAGATRRGTPRRRSFWRALWRGPCQAGRSNRLSWRYGAARRCDTGNADEGDALRRHCLRAGGSRRFRSAARGGTFHTYSARVGAAHSSKTAKLLNPPLTTYDELPTGTISHAACDGQLPTPNRSGCAGGPDHLAAPPSAVF